MTLRCDHCGRRPAELEVPIVLARVLEHSVKSYSGGTSTTVETTTRLEFIRDDCTRLCRVCERRRILLRFLVGPSAAATGFAVVGLLGVKWADGELPRIPLPWIPEGDIVPLIIIGVGLGLVWVGLVTTLDRTRDALAVAAYHERVTAAGLAESYTTTASDLEHCGRLAILPARAWRSMIKQRQREEAKAAKHVGREER